ncbi:type VI secretion system baseplate subunit TssE [Hafnia paralvei]|uniref:Type VI secretion system baseplate subunit TssE n=1 Tax=Hafnia paralvei TaxID=546367 RepID=A0A2A2ME81_9GAMM|nr:type VI secretion system baseplate subunit TssE [Hafnia paralvei]AMH18778.1 type VI secretion system baseplate subunit TssE [Hafnia paralvei]KHS47079.1 type VI secretion protein [Hafnia paralvei]MCK2180223.1 type VI secretion system baseplate subunit TssE [Hafnia paralvei]PAV97303.1 type VI secretion system baseplate subunit TssE [Hafnia paralvei]TBL56178.1 type VI secretion system baseplate subunit TssE [Hafnia paralvei]
MITERASGSSLFERIGEAAKPSSDQHPKLTLLKSIRGSLQNILNTRSGSCYSSPELGLPDLNDESMVSMNIRDVTAWIVRECILRYEPRISDVTIIARAQDENVPLELCFHILVHVNLSNRQDVLEFDMLLDNHQHWRVE